MKYGITGFRSTIAQEFCDVRQDNGEVVGFQEVHYNRDVERLPLNLDRYLLCAGVLHGESATTITDAQIVESMSINMIKVIRFCDLLFQHNPVARVCIIGSMSGIAGSFDVTYAAAKAGVHMYVENKRLSWRDQHLVAVAPTIIADSGMTRRRKDLDATLKRGEERRLGRWLNAREVAKAAMFAIENDGVCNTVIKMNGGNW